MKVEITVSEEELNVMIEEFIKDKLELGEKMKLVDVRSYSGVYVFSDEGDESEKH